MVIGNHVDFRPENSKYVNYDTVNYVTLRR